MRVWKKMIFEIAMKQAWDTRSGPSFPDPSCKLTFVLSALRPTFCSLLFWPVFSSESVSNCIRTAKWVKWLQLHSVLESFNHLTWHPRPDQPTGLHEEYNKSPAQAGNVFISKSKNCKPADKQFSTFWFISKPGDWVWKCSNEKETEYFDIPTSNIGSAVKTPPPQLHHLFHFSSTLPFLAFNVPPFLELQRVMRYTCF